MNELTFCLFFTYDANWWWKNPQEKDYERFSWANKTGSGGPGGPSNTYKKNILMLKSV